MDRTHEVAYPRSRWSGEVLRVESRPNIVLFMTDQLRRDALGGYGNTICRTPNLDRMAARGVRFDNAFTVSPVCSPARASIMTGLYPHNHGVMMNTHIAPAWSPGLAPDTPTFSGLLAQAGYALDYVGKWHVHAELTPCDFGFERHETAPRRYRPVPGSEVEVEFRNGERQLVAGIDGTDPRDTAPSVLTRTGIRMLRERAAQRRPFFLRIDLLEPHFPCLPPQPYGSMYAPQEIPPWANFRDDFAGKPPGHLRKLREWNLEGREWDWWSRVVAAYYGVVSHVDDCVGEILAAIEDLGIAERTVFVFCTDHGDALGSHGHFEKAGTMYDEIFRIPLLMAGPEALMAGGDVGDFARSLDLMPTFVEWADGDLPAGLDGRSLAPLLRGESVERWPDSVYCEHHGEVWGYQSQRMVRTKRWKYIYDPHSVDELYDLEGDPGELVNRAEEPGCREVLREMQARLLGWNDATGDMFQWRWVRWNLPDPLSPEDAADGKAPWT